MANHWRLALGLFLALAGCGGGRPGSPVSFAQDDSIAAADAVIRGFDHMSVGVADLDAAKARFRALGFTLKPGRPHDNGIRNAHAKFADGTYIELITAPAARDGLTSLYRRHIAEGDGPAFLSLFAPDISRVAAALAPMGDRLEDEGYVSFRDGDALSAFFFGDRPRSPTDQPQHFVHSNGAEALERVWIAPSDPADVEQMLAHLGIATRPERRCLMECGAARVANLAQGELVLFDADKQYVSGRTVLGVTIRVSSITQLMATLAEGPVSPSDITRSSDGERIIVSPVMANGMWIEFREAIY